MVHNMTKYVTEVSTIRHFNLFKLFNNLAVYFCINYMCYLFNLYVLLI